MTMGTQTNRTPPEHWFRSLGLGAQYFYFCVVLIVAAMLVLAGETSGQDSDNVIRVDTELATFEVAVTDRNGKPVQGLRAEDFRIFEDGVEREIDFFQPIVDGVNRRPLLTVFALDVSGSMTNEELEGLRSAMEEFVRRLSDANSYFAITTFAMDVKRLQSFSNRPERIRRSFERIKRDRYGLSTHAYDAVDDAIRMIERNAPRSIRGQVPKRSVVVISDGFPVGDVVSPQTVIERANAAEVSVYSVLMPSYSRLQGSKRPILTPFEASGLVELTGGINLFATKNDLEPLFRELAEKVSGTYAVAFYPNEKKGSADEFRTVRVESTRGHEISQNRPGYHPK
ncbi:hypothetical protein BH24ACI3_BH24ACI3_02840 [soil metagenome]